VKHGTAGVRNSVSNRYGRFQSRRSRRRCQNSLGLRTAEIKAKNNRVGSSAGQIAMYLAKQYRLLMPEIGSSLAESKIRRCAVIAGSYAR